MKPNQRKYPRRPTRLLAAVLMTAVSVGLWPLAGAWYTIARQPYLTAEAVAVPIAGAEELPATESQLSAYEVVSAARALDSAGKSSGYVIISVQTGYKSVIRVQSTFTADGSRLAGVRVLSQNETEYLGERIATEDFTGRFAGRRLPMKLWGVASIGSPIDGLSGSTISAQAVVRAVNNAYGFLQAYLGQS